MSTFWKSHLREVWYADFLPKQAWLHPLPSKGVSNYYHCTLNRCRNIVVPFLWEYAKANAIAYMLRLLHTLQRCTSYSIKAVGFWSLEVVLSTYPYHLKWHNNKKSKYSEQLTRIEIFEGWQTVALTF